MIEGFTEKRYAFTENEWFDREEYPVHDACFHEHGIDLRSAANSDLFEATAFQFLDKIYRTLVCRFGALECLGLRVDDIDALFERAGQSGIGIGSHDDYAGALGELDESLLVIFARPEGRVLLVLGDESVCGDCGYDEYVHIGIIHP